MSYSHNGQNLEADIYYQDGNVKRPCILVAHAWMGKDDFAKKKAESLAKLGYVGVAVDMYGKRAHSVDEAKALMNPLFMDRALLQGRLKVAYDLAKELPMVDSQKMGGIGFCFGGLAIIELFRSGVDLQGVVSFHAVLGRGSAKPVPISKHIKGSLLMLHGHDDPLVTKEDIDQIQKELSDQKIDWQMHIYSNTSHAFTNPEAHEKAMGLIYNPLSEKRSWLSMKNFFEEKFA